MATVTIPLTQNKVATIDEEDLPLVSQHRWFAVHSEHTFYARTNVRQPNGTYRVLAMHRLITNAPADMIPNHEDGDGLNNTRKNLVLMTKGDNNRHRVRVRGVSVPLPKTEREGWRAMQARYGNRIPLGSYKHPGLFALVDAEDYERVAQYRWTVQPDGARFYAIRKERDASGKWCHVSMHAFVMGTQPGEMVDHIHGNGLDNRKSELRICTNTQNVRNKRKARSNKTGYKCVAYYEKQGRWGAYICFNRKQMSLGRYSTPEEAAHAYDVKARELFGEFARLNFPDY